MLDARVDGKRGQNFKQRGYGIIQKANILSFQGPNALQLLAIQQSVFVPRDHILVRYEIPVRRYVLRPKPGRTA